MYGATILWGEAGPWEGSLLGPQQLVHFRRQRVENERRLRGQMARGRPDPGWRRCGDRGCIRLLCLYGDGPWVLKDKEQCRGGIPVSEIVGAFAQAVAERIWPEAQDRPSKLRSGKAVESFIWSPPVRGAFVRFVKRCMEKELDPSGEELADELTAARPQLEKLVSGFGEARSARAMVHAADRDEWKLRECVVEFLVAAEAWWRHAAAARPEGWMFGGTEGVVDVLLATLLHLWLMNREGCFGDGGPVDAARAHEAWEDWLFKFPLPETGSEEEEQEEEGEDKEKDGAKRLKEDDETQGGESECIEGSGRYVPPWMYSAG